LFPRSSLRYAVVRHQTVPAAYSAHCGARTEQKHSAHSPSVSQVSLVNQHRILHIDVAVKSRKTSSCTIQLCRIVLRRKSYRTTTQCYLTLFVAIV